MPYRVSSDLSTLDGSPLAWDESRPAYLSEKREALEHRRDSLLLPARTLAPEVWQEIGENLWQTVSPDQAQIIKTLGLLPDGSVAHGAQEALQENQLQALWARQFTLVIQENWVLISPQGNFEAGSVCFPSVRALFLIKVYVQTLEQALCGGSEGFNVSALRAERLTLLKASLKSMSEAVIGYKGLREIRRASFGDVVFVCPMILSGQ